MGTIATSSAVPAAVDRRSIGGSRPAPVAPVLRDIARGGLAGILGGLIVGGLGGRVVMRVATLLSPTSIGRRTENGELVGAITIEGTLALIMFGGLFSGIVAGVVWVVASPWIPGTGTRRALLTIPVAIAIASFFLVRPDNGDFRVLAADGPIIVMLIVLVGLMGGAIAWFDAVLDRRLPGVSAHPRASLVGYGAITILGVLFVPLAVSFFTSRQGCGCADPPTPIGLAMIAVGIATAAWWAMRISGARRDRPPGLLLAGRVALVAAVGFGAARLVADAGRILAAG